MVSNVRIVAEIGSSHQGDLEHAAALINAAADAGAAIVKTQTRTNKDLYTQKAFDRSYDSEHAFGPTYGSHREALELSASEHSALAEICRIRSIDYWSTAFDHRAVDLITKCGASGIKIASGDATDIDLISYAVSQGLETAISLGGCEVGDVRRAHEIVHHHNACHATYFLACTMMYPAPPEKLNLKRISNLKAILCEDAHVGASLHDNGISSAVVATMLGAEMIETHFTLDRAGKGADNAFSLEPTGLRKMVRDVREAGESIGSGQFHILDEERPALSKMRKTIVASRLLYAGDLIGEGDFVAKVTLEAQFPPNLEAYLIPSLYGLCLNRDLQPGETLEAEDFSVQVSTG